MNKLGRIEARITEVITVLIRCGQYGLSGSLDFMQAETYMDPMPNTKTTPHFWALGMLRLYTIGRGSVNRMTSVTILQIATAMYSAGKVRHVPSTASMTEYAFRTGWHANNRENVMTGEYMAIIPMVVHMAMLNQRCGDRRR